MTLYQLPLSLWFLQIVTCSAPTLSLWAGCDMVVSFSLSFRHATIAALREATKSRNSRGVAHRASERPRLPQGNGLGSLPGTATALSVPSKRPWLRMVQREEGNLSDLHRKGKAKHMKA